MGNFLKNTLLSIIDNIDAGNSNINEEQTIEIASAIGELMAKFNNPKIPNTFTRTTACRYLNISESKFNSLRNKGLISNGSKFGGDVRKWTKKELDEYIETNKK